MHEIESSKTQVPMEQPVRGLGYFSIGLGLAELLAPGQVSRGAGMRRQNYFLRGSGLSGNRLLASASSLQAILGLGSGVASRGACSDVANVAVTTDRRKPVRSGHPLQLCSAWGCWIYIAPFNLSPNKAAPASGTNRDYSRRSGFPRGIEQMRGAAAKSPEKAAPRLGCGKTRPAQCFFKKSPNARNFLVLTPPFGATRIEVEVELCLLALLALV